jgi:hypothetical protein
VSDYSPKVGLILQTDLPSDWIDEFEEGLSLDRAEIEIRKIYSGPIAGVALYMPQAVMIFIATAYFGGAFAELGKDHYSSVKSAVIKLWNRVKFIQVSAIGNASKIKDFDKFQMAFSVCGQTPNGEVYKLILQLGTEDQIAQEGIGSFLSLIGRIHDGTITSDEIDRIERCNSVAGTRVLTINPKTGELDPAEN